MSGYFAERSTISAGNLQKIADFFNVDKGDIDERYKGKENDLSKYEKNLLLFFNKLNDFGKKEAIKNVTELSNNSIFTNIHNEKLSESKLKTNYYSFSYIEKVSAGGGYYYGENEISNCFTDRCDFKDYDFATEVFGNSMYPVLNDGDIILVKSGYDNVNGDIYVIDYNGESYVKKLYNDGDRFRLVSVNKKYDNIIINIPIDDEVYFNIVGKVVDSFTPVEI